MRSSCREFRIRKTGQFCDIVHPERTTAVEGSALVQAVPGLGREAITANHLFTNECLKDEIFNMIETLKKIFKGTSLSNSGNALIEAREAYLLAAFDEIDKEYGSMDAFLEKGLGADACVKAQFQAKYPE